MNTKSNKITKEIEMDLNTLEWKKLKIDSEEWVLYHNIVQ